MAKRKLRVGVIGLGMGKFHLSAYKKHPHVEIAAIADINAKRLHEVGDEFEVPLRYGDGKDMLRKETLDIVSVATPNRLHMPHTIAALKTGAHVLCEKPMAMNANEARQMNAVAKQVKRRIMIDFSYRFTEASAALKREVDKGVLGDIYFGRTMWQRRRGMPGFGGWFGVKSESGGGPLIDLGVHRLDLALWLMGYPKPKWVLASTYDHIASGIAKKQNKKFDVEDFAVGLIKFENGATLEVEASWAGNIKEPELMQTRLLGTSGGLVQYNTDGGYTFDADLFVEKRGKLVNLKPTPPARRSPDAMTHFADAILKDRPHMATGEEGCMVMELLDAIYKSAKLGRPVEIKS
ncbi:MAG: Gfo/Idh/MocA family oxidoreductase [Verrucomicrobia bacterium]|nr:Gfo/Idh/MocA family oxidoreductase [Verrucomicrobiota bacterium]